MTPWDTHTVDNQWDEWSNFDLLAADPALQEGLQRHGAQRWLPALAAYAQRMGATESWLLAAQANQHAPQLQRFDARGRPRDQVIFDPAWHQLLAQYREAGWVSLPFDNPHPGRWCAWAAAFYLHGQVEQGTLCPATMTTAAIPLLRKEPALWSQVQALLFSRSYDMRDQPWATKTSIWLGMGMTEKQGGSDVRSNTTVATPEGPAGRGGSYRLRGHKWFFSAPTSDAHLVVAQLAGGGGLGCFWVPRYQPDGTHNAIRIQRLKDKLGNRSNASSEVEFQDAWALMVGPEGRGVATILEMGAMTRLNCVLGSSAILRMATVQSIAYARQRHAFGRPLVQQPLMRAVLADLALESEAALVLSLRLAQAFERAADDALEAAYQRLLTPAAKFWVCKRAVALTGEAMEVLGGNGYVEDSIVARLYREAPVNSIWEGSGNVMCLDLLRGLARHRDAAALLLQDLLQQSAGEPVLLQAAQGLIETVQRPAEDLEGVGRLWAQQLVLLTQACLLRQHAPDFVAEAFMGTRLASGGRIVGALDPGVWAVDALLQRSLPQ